MIPPEQELGSTAKGGAAGWAPVAGVSRMSCQNLIGDMRGAVERFGEPIERARPHSKNRSLRPRWTKVRKIDQANLVNTQPF